MAKSDKNFKELVDGYPNKRCKECPNKKDLYICLENGMVLCRKHVDHDLTQLKKDNLLVICSRCSLHCPIEKTVFKDCINYLKIYEKKLRILGCTGLKNLGNTCFINAIIQALSSIKCVKKYFLNHVNKKEIYGVLKEFCVVLDGLWQGDKIYEPTKFINNLDIEFQFQLNRNRHQDTLEFFHLFHEIIDKQLNTQIESTYFSDIFMWEIEQSIECSVCSSKSLCSEKLLELPLCIPKNNQIKILRNDSEKLMTTKDNEDLARITDSMFKKLKQ
jgi:uncharacterized UBP type Zn finger protein